MDSFHLFLRLLGKSWWILLFSRHYLLIIRFFKLGRSLKKWNENPRYWNQLKGRIYSKFSAAKLSSLNEIGVYHFISLFLTLALTADLQEVVRWLALLFCGLKKSWLFSIKYKLFSIWMPYRAKICRIFSIYLLRKNLMKVD